MEDLLLTKSNYPIIVMEGPDGVGKTVLSMALKKKLDARYLHLTYRFKNMMSTYHTAAIKLAARSAQSSPAIIDRWWISEIIYAQVYRQGSKFIRDYFLLEHVANRLGVVYVLCLPKDRQTYVSHYNRLKGEREEMYDHSMEDVYDQYESFYRQYLGIKENVIRYDMFSNYAEDESSREKVLSDVCQNILEFTEDYRSVI